jgi:hypothetical protein
MPCREAIRVAGVEDLVVQAGRRVGRAGGVDPYPLEFSGLPPTRERAA